jgi:osmoprotectant transport system substrate-binding protein
MMRRTRILLTGAVAALGAAACGAPSPPPTPPTTAAAPPGPRITIGYTDGSDTVGASAGDGAEQLVVANLYAAALVRAGARVTLLAGLGGRPAVEPALAAGRIDLYPDAAGSLLVFLDGADAGLATRPTAAVAALRTILGAQGATVLDPSPAVEGPVFAVTRATADQYHLTDLSSLAPVAGGLVLGGPPSCPQEARCLAGLQDTYGLHFKSFTSLDAAGPVTVSGLVGGEVQVGELAASDGTVVQNDLVALADDKQLEPADLVIPVIRTALDTPPVARTLDRLSAELSTAALSALVTEVTVGHADPGTVARRWVDRQHSP